MADSKELERIAQAQTYIQRYYEFEDAIKVNKENRAYLRTYIHDEAYVDEQFDMKSKKTKSIGIAVAAGLVMFLILVAVNLVAAIVAFVVVTGMAAFFLISLQHYRLTEAQKNQVEVNAGIEEQIQLLKDRDEQLLRQKDDYYKGLEKRIDFMSLDYMRNIDQIKSYIESGEADTCEDAVEVFERNMLLQEMTSLTSMSALDEPVEITDVEAAKERFGDPLELIKQNKKKKKKEKKAKKA